MNRSADTKELLEELLEGASYDAENLDETLAHFQEEDQYLDYKDGRITTEKTQKRLKHEILLHVTGFANAVGGLLIVGVSEDKPRKVTGAKAPGGSTLVEWASRILTGPLGGFSPPPRIFAVAHRDGEVLVVAVARAPQLVPYVEAGELKYSIRIGESTVEVPSYLISDLVLGRRTHPVLNLSEVSVTGSLEDGGKKILLQPVVVVDNVSLPAAVDTAIAIVTWSRVQKTTPPINDALRRYVSATPPPDYGADIAGETWMLRHLVAAHPDLTIRAFDRVRESITAGIRIPREPGAGKVRFGLYVMPRLSPPTWYQVECQYSVVQIGNRLEVDAKTTKFERSDRPLVEWSPGFKPSA